MNQRGTARRPLAERLKSALEDGIQHAKGVKSLRSTTLAAPSGREYQPADVLRIRQRLGLSQAAFARYLQVNIRTLQSWEQGLRKPSRPTMRLLQIFDEPGEFAELLKLSA